MLYIRVKIDELWSKRFPVGRQNTEECKHFSSAFLVHRSAERDEICHDEAQHAISYFSELWSTFAGAQIFDSPYIAHLSEHSEIWKRYRGLAGGQSILVPRIW